MKKLLQGVLNAPLSSAMAFALVLAATAPILAASAEIMSDPGQDFGGVAMHRRSTGAVLGESTTSPESVVVPKNGQACQDIGTDGNAQVCLSYQLGDYNAKLNNWKLSVGYNLKNIKTGSVYLDDKVLVKRVVKSGRVAVRDGIGAGQTKNLIFYSQAGGKGDALATLPVVIPDASSVSGQQDADNSQSLAKIIADCGIPAAPQGFHYLKGPEAVCAVLLVKDGSALPQPRMDGNGLASSTPPGMRIAPDGQRPPMGRGSSTPPQQPANGDQ